MKEASVYRKVGFSWLSHYGVATGSPTNNTGEPKMLYLAIDQHAKQITVCIRNEDGDTVLRRQVSTRPAKIESFFQQLTKMDAEFMAILEVCGFNDC